jgi:hypothetical protein
LWFFGVSPYHLVVTISNSDEAEAVTLLGPPPRLKMRERISLLNEVSKDTSGVFPPLILGILLGVGSNATYDLAKVALLSFLRRISTNSSAVLEHDEAFAIALWAIVRNFGPKSRFNRGVFGGTRFQWQWQFTVRDEEFKYQIVIPPGKPDVARFKIRRWKDS